jgi:hypothetical protein
MAPNVGESTSDSSSIAGDGGASFQCNICFELPHEPIVTLCGHLFCSPCLYQWLRIRSHSPECPVCKAVVKEDKLIPLYCTGKDRVDPRSKNNVPADELEEELVGNQQADVAAPARSIYLLVNTKDTRPVHPVYKVDYPYRPLAQPLRQLAALEIKGGRTFVSVQTRRRKWIVAVAGRRSVVFDAETEEVIRGPKLINGKERPMLVAVEDKIYALSSFPRVKGKRDFEPWFEVLDLSRATVVGGRLHDCAWEELPSPPCFPCQLSAREFFSPPMVIIESYVVLGSYILMSVRSHQPATYAFDTVSAKWHKIHGKSLPFIGRATAQHGVTGLYLGERPHDNHPFVRQGDPAISAYSIKLTSCDKEEDDDIKLSITEFPVTSSETCNALTGLHYASLDKGIFCSLVWKSRKRIRRCWDHPDLIADEFRWSKKATITLKTYQMQDSSLLQEDEQVKKIAISQHPEQAFKIRTKSGGFISPAFLAVFYT